MSVAPNPAIAARCVEVYNRLVPRWPDQRPLVHHHNCFELLIAVMLSAQTTDEQVNAVTPVLFARYPDAWSLAGANIDDVASIIHPVGFFNTKARHIVRTAQELVTRLGGKVPDTMEDLLSLPGVGRKTANLVHSACHDAPGIIVDTHVLRVLYRLGITPRRDPGIAEEIVRVHLDHSLHTAFSYAVNRHGKFVCTARKPCCTQEHCECPLLDLCPRRDVAGRHPETPG